MKTKIKTEIPKADFLMANYELKIVPDEDEEDPGFIVMCPQLSGLMGYGPTQAKAIADFHRMKSDWFDLAVESGISVMAPAAEVPVEYSGKFMVRMTPELHMVISKQAEANELSLNSYIVQTLREKVKGHSATSGLTDAFRVAMREVLPELTREIRRAVLPMAHYRVHEEPDFDRWTQAYKAPVVDLAVAS